MTYIKNKITLIFVRYHEMMTQSLHKKRNFKNISIYPIFFSLKIATMSGQTWKNKKIQIFQVYLIKSYGILSGMNDVCTSF